MKKIKYLFIMLFSLFFGTSNIYALEADFSNVKLTMEGITEEKQTGAKIIVSNVVMDSEKNYKVVITEDEDSVVESFTETPFYSQDISDNLLQISTIYLSAAEKYGDVYFTFYEKESYDSPYKKVSKSILVERPAELKLTKRISGGLFAEDSTLLLNSINDLSTVKKANYKIGQVLDNSILKSIKNGNYKGLENLLTYAKNDTNYVKTGNVEIKAYTTSLFSQSDVVEGNYYYVYYSLDTEDGKYYPVEDINLYYAKSDGEKIWLYDYLSSNFVWNIEEDQKEEDISLTEWDKYVELFKKNEYVTEYKKTVDSAGGTFTLEHDSSTLKITLKDENYDVTTIFNYNNGIVSYEADKNIDASELMFSNIWISVAIDVLCNKFGYDTENVMEYLETRGDFTLSKDGIEYTIDNVTSTGNSGNSSASITTDGFNMIKFDIINGLKTYKKNDNKLENIEDEKFVDETIENPKTGISSYIIPLILVMFIGIILNKKFKKNNKFVKIR